MSCTVSVVMPVRDGGPFLQVAVASILSQSLNDLELIVVDDHSRDGALGRLGRDDNRLQLLRSNGEGVSSAFNTGMEHARGAYIARMDADDVALPNRLQTQFAFLENNPGLDLCGACVEIFSDVDLAGGNQRYQDWLNACRTPQQIRNELFVESPIPNPTAFFRSDSLRKLGGYGDPSWPEDYDLFLRADLAGMAMAKPEPTLLRWREHGARLTRTSERYTLERFQAAKLHYLARGRLQGHGPVIIWGAGPTGRLTYDLLNAERIEVAGFLEVHPRRIGGYKRGRPVWSLDELERGQEGFVLVAVGAAGARLKIREHMRGLGRIEGEDYLFVA